LRISAAATLCLVSSIQLLMGPDYSPGYGAVTAVICGSISLILVVRSSTLALGSAGAITLTMFMLFNVGLAPYVAFGIPIADMQRRYENEWLYTSATESAFAIVALCFSFYSLAYCTVSRSGVLGGHRGGVASTRSNRREVDHPEWSHAIAFTGGVAVTVGLTIMFLNTGAFADYATYNAVSSGLAWAQYLLVLGVPLLVASRSQRGLYYGLAALGIASVVLLSAGSRTTPAVAGALALVVYARTRRKTIGWRWLALVLIGLSISSAVATVRTNEAPLTLSAFAPTNAVQEFGGSLRPLAESVRWQWQLGEPPYDGSTYTAWMRGKLSGTNLESESAEAILHERVIGYNLAFSSVAEAFLNFRLIGVVLFGSLVGALMGSIDRWRPQDVRTSLVAIVICWPVLYDARQSSYAVVPQLLIGLGALALVSIVVLVIRGPMPRSRAISAPDPNHPQTGLRRREHPHE
jgi:hypothetical protein